MSTIDLKNLLHERIEHLTGPQLQKLYALFSEVFPEKQKPTARKLGTMPGLIKYMAPDFDEPLEDFKEYMPE